MAEYNYLENLESNRKSCEKLRQQAWNDYEDAKKEYKLYSKKAREAKQKRDFCAANYESLHQRIIAYNKDWTRVVTGQKTTACQENIADVLNTLDYKKQ